MVDIWIVLILLAAIVLSDAVTKMLPLAIPLPLVQIAMGAAIAGLANLGVTLEPDVFFLLFIPPLLFLDGWRIPKRGLFKDAATILELAIGLVFFNVVGLGFFVHWLIPPVPLAVGFALAAILSPTDPVAVSAITSRAPVPDRVMHILEGESLLNDASGLVCMRFALLAALTGTFSLLEATGTFLWLAAGGTASGVVTTWLVTKGKDWVSRRFGENTGAQIVVSMLIPFAAYLAAEALHCSGILAAVGAGVTMSYAELRGRVRGETRMQRAAVWNTVQFVANGAIFLVLGEQIPRIFGGAETAMRQAGYKNAWVLLLYVVAIAAALVFLRFAWTWSSLRLTLYRAAWRGHPRPAPNPRLVAAVSFAGARGAITLAGVLTFPLTMLDGSPFPARDISIFLAAGVIILSLVAASIALPSLLARLELPPEDVNRREEDRARAAAAEAGLRAVEKAQAKHPEEPGRDAVLAEAAAGIIDMYHARLERRGGSTEQANHSRALAEAERRLRLAGLRAEREEVFTQARAHRIDDRLARKLIRELDLVEARLAR